MRYVAYRINSCFENFLPCLFCIFPALLYLFHSLFPVNDDKHIHQGTKNAIPVEFECGHTKHKICITFQSSSTDALEFVSCSVSVLLRLSFACAPPPPCRFSIKPRNTLCKEKSRSGKNIGSTLPRKLFFALFRQHLPFRFTRSSF